MHNFVNRVCNQCGILDTDPHETPCSSPIDTEHLKKIGLVAIAWTKEDGAEPYDYCYSWETAQTMANEGYKIQAIANDGAMEMEEIQRICDYELNVAIDCFGEDHRK